MVIGSLGPLVESYRPDLIMDPPSKGVQVYRVMAIALAPYVDCFIAETMSCVAEASQAIEAIGEIHADNKEQHCYRPMLISYTLSSTGELRDGESAPQALHKTLAKAQECNVECTFLVCSCFIFFLLCHGT